MSSVSSPNNKNKHDSNKNNNSFETPNNSTNSIKLATSTPPIIPIMKMTNPRLKKTMTSYNYTPTQKKAALQGPAQSNQQNQEISQSNPTFQKVSQPQVTSQKRSFHSPVPPLNVINNKPLHKKPKVGTQRLAGLYEDNPSEQRVSDNALLNMLKSNTMLKRRPSSKKAQISPSLKVQSSTVVNNDNTITQSKKTLFVTDEDESLIVSPAKPKRSAVEIIPDDEEIEEISTVESKRNVTKQSNYATPVQCIQEASQKGSPSRIMPAVPVTNTANSPAIVNKQVPIQVNKGAPANSKVPIPLQISELVSVEVNRSTPVHVNKVAVEVIKKAPSNIVNKSVFTQVSKKAQMDANVTTILEASRLMDKETNKLASINSDTPSTDTVNKTPSASDNSTTPMKTKLSIPIQISKVTPVHNSVKPQTPTPTKLKQPIVTAVNKITPIKAKSSLPFQITKITPVQVKKSTPIKSNKLTSMAINKDTSTEPHSVSSNDIAVAKLPDFTKSDTPKAKNPENNAINKTSNTEKLSLATLNLKVDEFYGSSNKSTKETHTPLQEQVTGRIILKSLPMHSRNRKSLNNSVKETSSQSKSANTSLNLARAETPSKIKEDISKPLGSVSLPLPPNVLLSNLKHKNSTESSAIPNKQISQESNSGNDSPKSSNINSSNISTQIPQRSVLPGVSTKTPEEKQNRNVPPGSNISAKSVDVSDLPTKSNIINSADSEAIVSARKHTIESIEKANPIQSTDSSIGSLHQPSPNNIVPINGTDLGDKGGNIFNSTDSKVESPIKLVQKDLITEIVEYPSIEKKPESVNTSAREPEVSEININSDESDEDSVSSKNETQQKGLTVSATEDNRSSVSNNASMNHTEKGSTKIRSMDVSNLLNSEENQTEVPHSSESQIYTTVTTPIEVVPLNTTMKDSRVNPEITNSQALEEPNKWKPPEVDVINKSHEEYEEAKSLKSANRDTNFDDKDVETNVGDLVQALVNSSQFFNDDLGDAQIENKSSNIERYTFPENPITKDIKPLILSASSTASVKESTSTESTNIKTRVDNLMSQLFETSENEHTSIYKRKHTGSVNTPETTPNKKAKISPTVSEPKASTENLAEKTQNNLMDDVPLDIIPLQASLQVSIKKNNTPNSVKDILSHDGPLVSTEQAGSLVNLFSRFSKIVAKDSQKREKLEDKDDIRASVIQFTPDMETGTSKESEVPSPTPTTKMEIIYISDSDGDQGDVSNASSIGRSSIHYIKDEKNVPFSEEEQEEESNIDSSSLVDPYEERKKFERNFTIFANDKLKDRDIMEKSLVSELITSGVAHHSPLNRNPTGSVSNNICSVDNFEGAHTVFYQQIHKKDRISYLPIDQLIDEVTFRDQYALYPESISQEADKPATVETSPRESVKTITENILSTSTQTMGSTEMKNTHSDSLIESLSSKHPESVDDPVITNPVERPKPVTRNILSSDRKKQNEPSKLDLKESISVKNTETLEKRRVKFNLPTTSGQNSTISTPKKSTKQEWKNDWLTKLKGASIYFSCKDIENTKVEHIKDEFNKIAYVFCNIFKCDIKNTLDSGIDIIILGEIESEIKLSKENLFTYYQSVTKLLAPGKIIRIWSLDKVLRFIKDMAIDIDTITKDIAKSFNTQYQPLHKYNGDGSSHIKSPILHDAANKNANIIVSSQSETTSVANKVQIPTVVNGNDEAEIISEDIRNAADDQKEIIDVEMLEDNKEKPALTKFKPVIISNSKEVGAGRLKHLNLDNSDDDLKEELDNGSEEEDSQNSEDESDEDSQNPDDVSEEASQNSEDEFEEEEEMETKEKSKDADYQESEDSEVSANSVDSEGYDEEQYQEMVKYSKKQGHHQLEEEPNHTLVIESIQEDGEARTNSTTESDDKYNKEFDKDSEEDLQVEDYQDAQEHHHIQIETEQESNQEQESDQEQTQTPSRLQLLYADVKKRFLGEDKQNVLDSDKSETILEEAFLLELQDICKSFEVAVKVCDTKSKKLEIAYETIESLCIAHRKQQAQISGLRARVEEQEKIIQTERDKSKRAMNECLKALVANESLKAELENQKKKTQR